MASVLYITYDGLLEPLGMSQVWQYLQVLSKTHNIIIISYQLLRCAFQCLFELIRIVALFDFLRLRFWTLAHTTPLYDCI